VVPHFLPAEALTLFYGDAGVYKSYVATYLACALAGGCRFLGLPTLRAPVLYVDTELDQDEFARRAYAVARGLNLSRPPEGLFYHRLGRSLADDETFWTLAHLKSATQAGLVVIDSLTLGAYGANLSDIDIATRILAGLKSLGTTLAVDHIPRPHPGADLRAYRPFGSMAKYAEARSVVQILKAEGGGVVLRPAKSNFGPVGKPLGVKVTFTRDAVRFDPTDPAELEGAEEHLPALERVAAALARCGEATAEMLAEDLGVSVKRVQNCLTELRRRGRAETNGRGFWRATGPEGEWPRGAS
jgi:hypothetical protein